ncbi:MAG: alpha/beta fold hydrolase [Halobacteria archaeon]
MSLLVTLAVVVVVLVLFSIVGDICLKKYYGSDDDSDEIHTFHTSDGVELSIYRYIPAEKKHEHPVLVVHGLASNNRNLALNEETGLVQYLRDKGFECWALDLRGRCGSEVPSGNWSYQDYSEKDVPAAVEFVKDETDADGVHWVGHSMGGMLFYTTAPEREDYVSAVTLGSPAAFQDRFYFLALAELGKLWSPLLKALRRNYFLPFLTRWAAVWLPITPRFISNWTLNKSNIKMSTARKFAANGMAMVSFNVLLEFGDWIVDREWRSPDGEIDYYRRLSHIDVPTLVVAGKADQLAPERDVEVAYHELGTDRKEFIHAGEGTDDKYGHVDMAVGDKAREQVFPEVEEWLSRFG